MDNWLVDNLSCVSTPFLFEASPKLLSTINGEIPSTATSKSPVFSHTAITSTYGLESPFSTSQGCQSSWRFTGLTVKKLKISAAFVVVGSPLSSLP